jgi:hypothetical protein
MNVIYKKILLKIEKDSVGVAGFEPAASCSQSRRDNRATLHPVTYFFLTTFPIPSGRDNWATLRPELGANIILFFHFTINIIK